MNKITLSLPLASQGPPNTSNVGSCTYVLLNSLAFPVGLVSSHWHSTPKRQGAPAKLPLWRFYQISEQGPWIGVEAGVGLEGDGYGFYDGMTLPLTSPMSSHTSQNHIQALLFLEEVLRPLSSCRNPMICGIQGSASTFKSVPILPSWL